MVSAALHPTACFPDPDPFAHRPPGPADAAELLQSMSMSPPPLLQPQQAGGAQQPGWGGGAGGAGPQVDSTCTTVATVEGERDRVPVQAWALTYNRTEDGAEAFDPCECVVQSSLDPCCVCDSAQLCQKKGWSAPCSRCEAQACQQLAAN